MQLDAYHAFTAAGECNENVVCIWRVALRIPKKKRREVDECRTSQIMVAHKEWWQYRSAAARSEMNKNRAHCEMGKLFRVPRVCISHDRLFEARAIVYICSVLALCADQTEMRFCALHDVICAMPKERKVSS